MFDPSIHWTHTSCLQKAREVALAIARQVRDQSASSGQVMLEAHLGYYHLDFFRSHLAPLVQTLPDGFQALEVGGGMAWTAALTALDPKAGLVIATEIDWAGKTPRSPENADAFLRIAERYPKLRAFFQVQKDQAGQPVHLDFGPQLAFARADAAALPARESSLDFLYSINCLEHIPQLARSLHEAARVLKPGGLFFASSEPLFFSAQGHHLFDIFPLPWGHLLWQPEELASIVVREAGADKTWDGVEPLQEKHLLKILSDDLNGMPPETIRQALRQDPWSIRGWSDLVNPIHYDWAREMDLTSAVKGISREALFLTGLCFSLRRENRARGLRLPLRLSHHSRRWLRRIRGKNKVPR